MKALDVIGHCHEGVMRLVWKVLPDLWSDHTLGYKTHRSFGAIIESFTALNNNQSTQPTLNYSVNMSMSSPVQYHSAKGLTITCPTAVRPLHNHRGDGPYPTPQEVHGSSMVVFPWLTFAVDCYDGCRSCHRVSGQRDLLPSWHLVAGGYDKLIGTNPLVQSSGKVIRH